MAYEARKNNSQETSGNSIMEDKKAQDERSNQNNANNIRNAADVAIASKNPYAMAAGAAVKAADKISGGKSTEALGKTMTRANKIIPGGRGLQKASNKLNESGASDKIGKAAAMKNNMSGGAGSAGAAGNAVGSASGASGTSNMANSGGGQVGSLPSSSEKKEPKSDSEISKARKSNNNDNNTSSNDGDEKKSKGIASFLVKNAIVSFLLLLLPFLLIIVVAVIPLLLLSNTTSEFEDALGLNNTMGEDTGLIDYVVTDPKLQEFYDRIAKVRNEYQTEGKYFDATYIIAIYHVLVNNGVSLKYSDITESVIRTWADAMLDGNMYNESYFRDNLSNNIFPKYFTFTNKEKISIYVDQVFEYVENYYAIIGRKARSYSSCASAGNCSYDIKGFYLPGRGNVVKNLQISDLKVRLMECGPPYGNGSYTKAIDQPLVNFEDYAAGVAYAEVGSESNIEVLKAQMVAARSFALSRPTSMGNSAGKKLELENGQWILQISSCVADQVFCNIDEGCSMMGGGDGQGGIVRSGKVAGAVNYRNPLPENHPLRQAAVETQGEVLVNSQGYIIATGFLSTDQRQWMANASKGLNYKQILLQHYNQGARAYGASDIQKMSCSTGESSNCISTGEFSKWRQGAPEWGSIPMGNSGKNIAQIGCLVTSISMQIAKSGVKVNPSINPFNPGTFVQFLNSHGGFVAGGNFVWAAATKAAPEFIYKGQISVAGLSRQQKLNKISELINQKGVYVVAEVKGNTGQHWVAIDSISGDTVNMMDPASDSTDMWSQYNWANTSTLAYYKVG